MYSKNHMVVIDDLEPIEAIRIVNFLTESISNGDFDLVIQDCITKYVEVKFHQYKANPDDLAQAKKYDYDLSVVPCDRCNKLKLDTIHTMEIVE